MKYHNYTFRGDDGNEYKIVSTNAKNPSNKYYYIKDSNNNMISTYAESYIDKILSGEKAIEYVRFTNAIGENVALRVSK